MKMTKAELETKLRDKEAVIKRLETSCTDYEVTVDLLESDRERLQIQLNEVLFGACCNSNRTSFDPSTISGG